MPTTKPGSRESKHPGVLGVDGRIDLSGGALAQSSGERATLRVVDDNLSIFGLLSRGTGTIMFTDAIEVFMRDFGGFSGIEDLFGARGGRGSRATSRKACSC